MSSIAISRVFINGHSQAVRIPKQFKLNVARVQISKNSAGDLVIHPIPEDRGNALLDALKAFDDEYIELLEQDQRDRTMPQEREDL